MMRAMLTSSGLENRRITEEFLRLLDKPPTQCRALFIPTAAIDPDAIAVLPKCMNDLLSIGIPPEGIAVFDLHRALSFDELCAYDIAYFTGGSPHYLLRRINESGFAAPLRRFVRERGVYLGVSAGSWVATDNLPDSLGLIRCTLKVHVQISTKSGPIDTSRCPHIELTGNSAILIRGDDCRVIE